MEKAGTLSKFRFTFPAIFRDKLFLAILFAKLVAALFLGTDLLIQGFIPFIQYFVSSGFQNPYNYFLGIGALKAFPYPPVMLAVLSVPVILLDLLPKMISDNLNALMLTVRLPILFADLLIFYVLVRWLKTNDRKVLLFYWASPILFYISYVHGQLDAIPIAFLIASLVLLFKEETMLSAVAAGMGLAAKTNIFLALPFICIYLWKNRSFKEAVKYLAISLAVFGAILLPFIGSAGFQTLVFGASENMRMFDLAIPLNFQGVEFFVAPAALLALLFLTASFDKINKDALMMLLALTFTIVVTLVPPAPGWYYWAIPFLIFFFVKQQKAPDLAFWTMNALYLVYFLMIPHSGFTQYFKPLGSAAFPLPTIQALTFLGGNEVLVSNLIFTFLTVTVLLIAYWIYNQGLSSNLIYRKKERPVMIGIGGDSGTGKTHTSELLSEVLGHDNVLLVNGDDMHRWERGDRHWEAFTHLNPEANKLHEELSQAVALSDGKVITRCMYDHSTGKFTEPLDMKPSKFVILVGLHPFYLKRMRELQDIKIFMEPEEELKLHWKMKRDVKARGYSKEQVMAQIDKRKGDKTKFIEPQKQFADITIRYRLRKRIQSMGDPDAKEDKYLEILLDNSIDMQPFVDELKAHKGISIALVQNPDLRTQTLKFYGVLSKAEVERGLYKLVPNFEELVGNESPVLEENDEGVLQLFVIYYLSEISKLRVRE